jgi:glycosyltransferase involved in cell wall biosynthesis
MKILIVSQYFYPEEFKINDLTKELVSRGHQVTVLTGKPNYPKGEYYEGYKYEGVVKETYCGAEVIRVPLRKRGAGGGKNLVLNYFSFVYHANKYIRKNKMEFEAILVFEISPITQAYPALYCKKKYGGKVLLWVQDLWPESVTAAGGVTNKFVLGVLDRMVKRIYKKCDVLMVQSEGFKKSILSKGDFASKIVYVPNWAEDLYLEKNKVNEEAIKGSLPDGFKVMFAGNVGAAQDVDSIVKAANETRDIPEIKWIIVGDGRARVGVEEEVNKLGLTDIVKFMGRHPMAEMPTYFSFADAMIVSLKDEYIFSLTIPAKTQSYMASGKPIVSMLNGEGNRIIEEAQCGLTTASGDYKALAENVKKLYQMEREQLVEMGKRGLDYYKQHFDKKTVVDNIINAM